VKYKPYNLKDVVEASKQEKFTVVSTFAGGGGSSTGYRLAGGKILCVNEFVEQAINTYKENYPDTPVLPDDIKKLTVEKAEEIYREKFWNPYNYDIITDPDVATKIFDITVNAGPRQSHKLVQRACNTRHKDLDVDGLLGTQSLRAINQIGKDLLPEICKVQADFYKSLVEKKPELKVFLKGWLRRAEA